jgi:pimeloyl-ACP methyl ester carboxylesterase
VHYRRQGAGFPLVFLHGGWGYGVYPFDRQTPYFQDAFDVVIPDRAGYGGSTRLEHFALPLHRNGAEETRLLLDALHIPRAVLWGHSDGAVIAALAGVLFPDRVAAVVLEAIHYDRRKPGSHAFFQGLLEPDSLDARLVKGLLADHGDPYWRDVVRMEGEAWLDIFEKAFDPAHDLYEGRLAELRVPALVVHGELDPRTEPGELLEVRRRLPRARFHVLPGAKHCPHHERAHASVCGRLVREFLDELRLDALRAVR